MFTSARRILTFARQTPSNGDTLSLCNFPPRPNKLIYPSLSSRMPRTLSTRWVLCATEDLVSSIREKNVQNKVVIYSRSWCPFCDEVKKLFASYNVSAKIIELDNVVEGDDIQNALAGMTGSKTVPQVFIDGKFVGGCDDTYALEGQGKLKPLLEN